MLSINLKEKFTSVHFEETISKYWAKSLESKAVEFDLQSLQWIAIEQLTFLISWINFLADEGVSLQILLPSGKNIPSNSQLFKRRQLCLNYLLIDWSFLAKIDQRVVVIYGEISPTKNITGKMPYSEIQTIQYDAKGFDNDFYDLYETSFKDFTNYVEKQIKDNTLLNYFDNHFLHYSLIKEFYSNVCQHAYKDPTNKSCFISLASNGRINISAKDILIENLKQRYDERPEEERSFFRDENGEYKNTAFIEFSFLDFGQGITTTLENKYDSEDYELIKNKFGNKHLEQNKDTQVLEYAFLLFTSQYELGKDFEMHDYIPRGLYIIKDIVKRYNGMILARSKKGKVIFNFNKDSEAMEIVYREDDFTSNIGDGFPGTSITIILPAKDERSQNKWKTKIKSTNNHIPFPTFINLLQFMSSIPLKENLIEVVDEAQKKVNFYEEFFKGLTTKILSLKSDKKNLILFDFAGIEHSNNDIYSKFIYFLAYCPLISQTVSVCMFNISERGISQSLITDQHSKKSKGFFAKPIPCIYPDLAVEWIGINNDGFEYKLTEVWKENFSKNELDADISHLSGSILNIQIDTKGKIKFNIEIQSYYTVLKLIYSFHKSFIEKELTDAAIEFHELKNNDHNYNKVLNTVFDKETGLQRAFLTANGKYQKEFLTFIEKLYIRDYRRLISVYFLFNLFFDNNEEDGLANIKKVTKILTVTLSSQLLGKEFTEIINDLNINPNKVTLIPLSNYYDFNNEDSFYEIKENDEIIVVNDVISTGNLSQKIIKSVSDRKAKIFSILTIIDSRSTIDNKLLIEASITSLFEKTVEKFENNPFKTMPIWVNPILNAPTTMSRDKSNRESILKSPQEFINFFKDDDIFKIGHFLQNTRHLTYYLQTDDFFKQEQKLGFPIITSMINALKLKILEERQSDENSGIYSLRDAHENFKNQLLKSNPDPNNQHTKNIIEQFTKFEQLIGEDYDKNLKNSKDRNQLVDFIFYPFLSSVSEIEKNLKPISLNLRGDHAIEIYPLPRIMTPKGWRFSFPPKFLNFHTKDKTALILDDGSCTGETIIQMIDSLSFLELDEIFVLSIFGRLEDFQREFLSRIKQVKVKDRSKNYKIIPVSVYFGTHFHIPIFNKNTHPSGLEIKEITEIEALYEKNGTVLPSHLQHYIETKRKDLLNPVNPKNSQLQRSNIPHGIVKRLMFVIRDLIGNYDSYRLFKEDEYSYNDQTPENHILRSLREILIEEQGKNALIAVLMQEPHLIDTVKRIYPELINEDTEPNNLRDFINGKLKSDLADQQDLFYFYVKSLFKIDPDSILDFNFLSLILKKIDKQKSPKHEILNTIGYFFTTIFLKTKSNYSESIYFKAKLTIQSLYLSINNLGLHDISYASLIKELYNESLLVVDDFPFDLNVKQLFNTQQYYRRQVSNHDGKRYSSHPNYYAAFESIINRLGVFISNPATDDENEEVHKNLSELVEKTKNRLFNLLSPVLAFLEPLYLNYDFEIDVPKHLKHLKDYEKLNESLKDKKKFKVQILSQSNLPQLLNWLENFNEMFFHLRSELPLFFINSKTNLRSIIEKTLTNHARKTKIDLEIPDDIYLEIHPYLLRVIFLELIENKYKHAPNSSAIIKYQETHKSLKLTYSQTSKFVEENGENGLITIRNIIQQCGGSFSYSSTPDYKIEINLPLQTKI